MESMELIASFNFLGGGWRLILEHSFMVEISLLKTIALV